MAGEGSEKIESLIFSENFLVKKFSRMKIRHEFFYTVNFPAENQRLSESFVLGCCHYYLKVTNRKL